MNEKFFDLKREKQDRMINAGLKVFAKSGYRHATTDDIVKEAGISKGLLFHYFTNKVGVYVFLMDYFTCSPARKTDLTSNSASTMMRFAAFPLAILPLLVRPRSVAGLVEAYLNT